MKNLLITKQEFLQRAKAINVKQSRGHDAPSYEWDIKFDNVKSKKLQDHLAALQSRCHYLDLTIDSMRDRMLRIRQICGIGMLKKYAMPKETEEELIQFIYDNKHKLREISLRMVLKIADLWKMAPKKYKELAEQTCMKPERELYDLRTGARL